MDEPTVSTSRPRPTRVSVDRLVVTFSADPAARSRTLVLNGDVTLGRGSHDQGLSIQDPELSRAHLSVSGKPGARCAADLHSHNGTFRNGTRIPSGEPIALVDGDVLRIGGTILVFSSAVLDPSEPLVSEHRPLFGRSLVMDRLRGQIRLAATDRRPALILGETGVGKELVAQTLHTLGARAGALVSINCGGLPGELIEAQLFGHEQGAFTGASSAGRGLFRAADNGTVFLDEIGELPLDLQPKLLRALGSGEARTVGGIHAYAVTARVVAATHRDLEERVEAGRFRRDLYMRLAAWTLHLPALRERREDILELGQRIVGPDFAISADAAEALLLHDWPGNVRELENILGVAAARSRRAIELAQLPPAIAEPLLGRTAGDAAASLPLAARVVRGQKPSRTDLELVLREHGGNVSAAARFFDVDRREVYRWLEEHQLAPDESRETPLEELLKVLERVGGNVSRAAEALSLDRKTIYRLAQRHGIDLTRYRER